MNSARNEYEGNLSQCNMKKLLGLDCCLTSVELEKRAQSCCVCLDELSVCVCCAFRI